MQYDRSKEEKLRPMRKAARPGKHRNRELAAVLIPSDPAPRKEKLYHDARKALKSFLPIAAVARTVGRKEYNEVPAAKASMDKSSTKAEQVVTNTLAYT